jgi:hypothetical protein
MVSLLELFGGPDVEPREGEEPDGDRDEQQILHAFG